jgi:proteasome lid subunit RPN8/RPN11
MAKRKNNKKKTEKKIEKKELEKIEETGDETREGKTDKESGTELETQPEKQLEKQPEEAPEQEPFDDEDSADTLPQNVIYMGDRVQEDKNIYISQSTYKEIQKFTKNKLTNESGGMLIGNVVEAFGKTNIIIRGFVEAKYSEATPTTLKFTHETWDYVHGVVEKKYEDGKILGWIHTHPDFGIFLSEYDKFIQNNFFREDYQIAYVVDPIQHIEGFYFWINDRIERCKGFYIFDKVGTKIQIEKTIPETSENTTEVRKVIHSTDNKLLFLFAGVMLVVCLIFVAVYGNLSKRTTILENKYDTLSQAAGVSIQSLEQEISDLQTENSDLQKSVKKLKKQQKKNKEETTQESELETENNTEGDENDE